MNRVTSSTDVSVSGGSNIFKSEFHAKYVRLGTGGGNINRQDIESALCTVFVNCNSWHAYTP